MTTPNPTFATDHIFISHSSADQPQVLDLINRLRATSLSCWVSFQDIPPGAHWEQSIEKALRAAAAVLVYVTKSSVESDYVRAEVDDAISRNKTVIPIIAENVELPLRWRALQYVRWPDTSRDVAIGAIVETLPQAALESLHQALGDPSQFERAKVLITQHVEWLPMEFRMSHLHTIRINATIFPDSPVDCFAGRLDTPGPRAILYYLCSPTDSPISPSGGARPHIRQVLAKVRSHLDYLSRPMPSEHILAPPTLFASEAHEWRMVPPRYTEFTVHILAGRRRHYDGRALAARELIVAKANRAIFRGANFRGQLDLMSYDRVLSNAGIRSHSAGDA